MKSRFYAALATYAALALLAAYTLDGNIRLATLIFIGGIAAKSYIFYISRS